MATVVCVGTLDTKGREYAFLRDRVREHGVDALLIDAGELCPGPKWRARRLQEVRPDALPWDEYWAVETMRAYAPERARSWIEDTMDRCRRLMLEIDAS